MMGSDEKTALSGPRTFPKKERLIKTGEFRKIYKSGSSLSSGPFVLKVLPNTLSLNRIGFSISSRSIKKAFRRNRVRRLFREVFRLTKGKLKNGFDMTLVVRKDPAVKFSYKDAENIFLNLARKARILV
ncbi:MAG: ribonuclease P protein component [Candidatus Omnitrophota bacterium]|nr:ribonuclease P protein component [Candidatus Omnitrophota bacterium]